MPAAATAGATTAGAADSSRETPGLLPRSAVQLGLTTTSRFLQQPRLVEVVVLETIGW